MSRVRLAFAAIVCALLAAGYLASQWAYLHGTAPDYSAKVDQTPIVILAEVVFIAAVVLCFWPDKQGDADGR
jgi:hypothetical protein